MPCLEVSGLTKVFSRGGRAVVAIENLDLAVEEGEFVSVVGPSGCGKTTLLHIVGGFEKPSSGRLALFGHDIAGPGPDRGVIFQEFSLYPWRTVLGNVVWGLEVQGMPRAERTEIAERFLEMVGLSTFRDLYPAELSGGMKQRVALARTLAFDPKLLLMDEPFGALDAQTREIMQEELQRIYERNRKTIVFITHDIDEAVYLGDRVLVFSARPGRIKEAVPIDLPRPRALEIKKTAEYHAYRNRVWDLLRDEVVRARDEVP